MIERYSSITISVDILKTSPPSAKSCTKFFTGLPEESKTGFLVGLLNLLGGCGGLSGGRNPRVRILLGLLPIPDGDAPN